MKRLILSLAIASCLAISKVKAQTVNDVKLSDLKEEYLEVSEYRKFLGEKIFISVDYGQKKNTNINARDLVVKDEKGYYLEYNSVIEFINIMKTHGYELFQAYSLTTGENARLMYILKRKSN
ncbi:MAG: hypothetical protein V4663_06825 [Bacteroidota bacterium]